MPIVIAMNAPDVIVNDNLKHCSVSYGGTLENGWRIVPIYYNYSSSEYYGELMDTCNIINRSAGSCSTQEYCEAKGYTYVMPVVQKESLRFRDIAFILVGLAGLYGIYLLPGKGKHWIWKILLGLLLILALIAIKSIMYPALF